MIPPRPQPDDGHTLRSLRILVTRNPDQADHAALLAMFATDAAVGEHVGAPVRDGPRPPVMSREPDATVMTTAAAACNLGLAGRDSARIWLALRGIRPVGREPGPSGQNPLPHPGGAATARPGTAPAGWWCALTAKTTRSASARTSCACAR